ILGALSIQARDDGVIGDSVAPQFTDGAEVFVTAHVTKEGTRLEESPGDVRQRLDVETEQIDKGNEKFAIHCGLRISIYDQRTRAIGEEQRSRTARLFHYGERLRFPAKLSTPRN